jgi:hypothetical protein
MGTPNCTFYDEAIPYDAMIPYDGICTSPVVVSNRPIYWVGKRSTWEKEKEEKRRREHRVIIAVSSEVFSVNDEPFNEKRNEIRVMQEFDPTDVQVSVSSINNSVQEPIVDIQSHITGSEMIPMVASELSDNNSGGLPEVEEIEDPTLEEEEEYHVESLSMDDNGNVQIMCELVTNQNSDLIIKVEAEDDNREPQEPKNGS